LHDDIVLNKTAGIKTFVTSGQHFILNAPFGRISAVGGLDTALRAILVA
jgi:ribose 5-phosphate isomerase A